MNPQQWKIFQNFKSDFKNQCQSWACYSKELIPLQKSSSVKDTPDYPIETPVVYNTALDELTQQSEIKLIVIGDNPGKNEQLSINQKYLVGQAGKIAEGYFKKNPELEIDFRKNVIILNKTPVHSAKTKHLISIDKELKACNSPAQNLIEESQRWMAKKTAALHQDLIAASDENSFIPELWLVGYTELKKNGIFIPYRDELKTAYTKTQAITTDSLALTDEPAKTSTAWQEVFVYQHFSMNCFSKDVKNHQAANPAQTLKQTLESLGQIHKEEIFY